MSESVNNPANKANQSPMTRRSFATLLFGVGAFAATAGLAGCGGGNTAGGASANGDSYTLVKEGKLICASDLAYEPIEYLDPATGKAAGYGVEYLEAVAKKMGLTCEFLPPQTFDTIIPMIKQGGKADVGVSCFTVTPERKQEIDFTNKTLDSNQAFITKGTVTDAGSEADILANYNDASKKIAAQSGSSSQDWIKENLPKATFTSQDDPTQCYMGVQSGSFDAMMIDEPVGSYACKNSYTDLKLTPIATGEKYALVVSKSNPGLTAKLNKAMAALDKDGTKAELQQKWFGGEI